MAESTPSNWPIYNVKLTKDQVRKLTSEVFPDASLVSYEELDRRKSFNNRIYFLDLKHLEENDFPAQAVLKIVGRFFGASKVQNEVACLMLLEKYCPDIPSPRVLAWSENGTKACAIRNGVFAVLHDQTLAESSQPSSPHGWVMTTRLPGRSLELRDLSPVDENLVAQLADIMSNWRTNIPHRDTIGNIALQSASYTTIHDVHGLDTIVSDLLLTNTQPSEPRETDLQYYQHLLFDQLHIVDTSEVFTFLRPRLSARLKSFCTSTLPKLPVSQPNPGNPTNKEAQKGTVFTHQDFAPRNILVSPSSTGLRVSGILDFEFAGFFPPTEEFLTCMVRQSDDWTPDFFAAFLSGLASRGIPVPGNGIDARGFDILCDLARLVENAAPWWLRAEHIQGEELERQLRDALKIVEEILVKLEKTAAGEGKAAV